ncbi:MAG: DUF305 domain-containing protein, partial [Ilumatobacteraceae bacterium]
MSWKGTRTTMRRLVISLSLIGVLAVVTGACGSSSSATSTASAAVSTSNTTTALSTEHNDADVTFAQKMIPHHQQALTMASMA